MSTLKNELVRVGFVSSSLSPADLKEVKEQVRSIRYQRARSLPCAEQYVEIAARHGVQVNLKVALQVAQWRMEKTRKGLI